MKWATTKRWGWILSLSLVSGIGFLTCVPLGQKSLPFPFLGDSYRAWLIWSVAFLWEVLLFAFVGMSLRFRRSQLPLAAWYPPLWVAILIGVVAATALWLHPASPLGVPVSVFQPELRYVLLPAAMLGLFLGHLPMDSKGFTLTSAPTVRRELSDLAGWAERESPADAETRDLFGREELVGRVAGYLSRPWGREGSVALLGHFGSGKSSIVAWVAAALSRSENPRICVAEVSCWGLESSGAAPVHALAKAIDALEWRVDCRSLRGLPAAYRRLIAAEPSGVLGKLLDGLGGRRDWQEQLGQLTPILQATNLRLLLLIEDADRAGGDFDPQHIQRLLWSLRTVPGVSFAIALDPGRTDIDVGKVCDHVERVPVVEPNQVRQVLRLLRDDCRSKRRFTDAVTERDEDPLDLREAHDRLEDYARRRYRNSLADAVCDLLPTPRLVKHVVRRVGNAWATLYGEIDIDDLIVASVLRVGAPECFQFLVEHIDGVREKETEFPQPPTPKESKLFRVWEKVRDNSGNSEAVQKLVDFLALEALCPPNAKVRPQGIQNSEPADYFRRLRDEVIPDDEIRDQEVLSHIDRYLATRDGPMLDRLLSATDSDRKYAGVWEHLSDRIPGADLREVANRLLAGIKERDGAQASGKHPSLLAVWRRCHARLSRNDETRAWLERSIAEALPVSLGLSTELYYFWASVTYGIVDTAGRIQVREAMVQQARSLYSDSSRLASALDAERPWSLRHLVTPVDHEEPASALIEPQGWAWLAEPLLALIAEGGTVIAAQVAHIVGDFDQQHRFGREEGLKVTESYRLNQERILAVFGSATNSVLEYLSGLPDEPSYLAAAREHAKVWLAQRRTGVDPGL